MSGVHPADHNMLMVKQPKIQEEGAEEGGDESVIKEEEDAEVQGDGEPVHSRFICDGCKMDPIAGVRYKCLEWVLSHAISASFTDGVVSSVALRALITTCARPVRPKVSTQLNTIC